MDWNSKYDPPTLNKQYGEWTVIGNYKKLGKINLKSKLKVQCSCGEIRKVNIYNLITGMSSSCGCTYVPRGHEKPNSHVPQHVLKKINKRNYALIDYINYHKEELESRVMSYTLTCPNGHIHVRKDTYVNLETFIDTHKCWCAEENPLIRERLRNNLTLEEVSDRFGISRQAVQYWESDKYNIPEKRLLKLLEIYQPEEHFENEVRKFKEANGLRIT